MATISGGSIVWDLDVEASKLTAGLVDAKNQINNTTKDISDSFKNVGKNVTSIGKDLSIGITAPIAAVSAVAFSFTSVAGKYSSVLDSFKSMTQGMGVEAVDFQNKIAEATGGQIDNLTILQNATKGLSLIGKDAFNNFGNDFVKMAALSKKAARATGQDVDFMFESLVTGIARESKLILDNLGVSLDITKAKEDYAESLGKTSSELTASESKHAVLNATMKQLEDTYGKVAISAGGFSGAWQELTTFFTNSRIEIGQKLEPVLADLTKSLTKLGKEIIPVIVDVVTKLVNWFTNLSPTMQKVLIGGIALAAALGPILVVVGMIITSIGTLIGAFTAIGSAIVVVVGFLSWPVVAIGLIIAAVIALTVAIYKNWDKIVSYTKNIWNGISDIFNSWIGKMYNWGANLINSFIDGIKSQITNAKNAIKNVLNSIKGFFEGHSPPLIGPLKDIDKWGFNIGDSWVQGFKNAVAGLSSANIGIPDLSGLQGQPAPALANGGNIGRNGGFNQNIDINIEKVENKEDIAAIGRELGYRASLML